METPGELMKAARKRSKKTQEEIASELSLTQAMVSKMETGVALPDIANARHVAHVYGIPERRFIDAVVAEAEARRAS